MGGFIFFNTIREKRCLKNHKLSHKMMNRNDDFITKKNVEMNDLWKIVKCPCRSNHYLKSYLAGFNYRCSACTRMSLLARLRTTTLMGMHNPQLLATMQYTNVNFISMIAKSNRSIAMITTIEEKKSHRNATCAWANKANESPTMQIQWNRKRIRNRAWISTWKLGRSSIPLQVSLARRAITHHAWHRITSRYYLAIKWKLIAEARAAAVSITHEKARSCSLSR